MAHRWAPLALALTLVVPPARAAQGTELAFVDFGSLLDRFRPRRQASAQEGPVFTMVSWNVQVFGKSVGAPRKRAVQEVLGRLFADPAAKVFAVQELANEQGASTLHGLLPGTNWQRSFENTRDSQDNGFYVREGAKINCSGFLYPEGTGVFSHPPRMAHITVGSFDFLAISLHLAFEAGKDAEAEAELGRMLAWIGEYLKRPGADPDIVLVGDFNLPTTSGKELSVRSSEGQWTPLEGLLENAPARFTALIDEQTSRSGRQAANNYDHFVLSEDLLAEEFIAGSAKRAPPEWVHDAESANNGVRASDHYPIWAQFRSGGAGNDGKPIALDGGACPR